MQKKARKNEIVSSKSVALPLELDSLEVWISLNRGNYTRDIHTLVLAAKFNDLEVNKQVNKQTNKLSLQGDIYRWQRSM